MGDIKGDIRAVLAALPQNDFAETAQDLLAVLDYRSERTLPSQPGKVADFITQLPAASPNTKSEQTFGEHVRAVRLVFQLTSDEIAAASQPTLDHPQSAIF